MTMGSGSYKFALPNKGIEFVRRAHRTDNPPHTLPAAHTWHFLSKDIMSDSGRAGGPLRSFLVLLLLRVCGWQSIA